VIVAIDGPAASGKGTLARRLAQHFDLAFLDTGLLYRATALRLAVAGGGPGDHAMAEAAARAVEAGDLADPRLREERIAGLASAVAAIPAVRQALLRLQRDFAAHPPGGRRGAVLDGRDIGTVVCPEAEAKLFVTASTEARAHRRVAELLQRGVAAAYERVLADMRERDARDAGRSAAPLRQAIDALVLDTTALDVDAAFAIARDFVAAKVAKGEKARKNHERGY